jgi:hypothetical protein
MSKHNDIDIKQYFFKYNTLTEAIREAERIGITSDTFNKWREGEGITNWSIMQRNYNKELKQNNITTLKSILYNKQEYNVNQDNQEIEIKEEDVLCIDDMLLVYNVEEYHKEVKDDHVIYNQKIIDKYVESFLIDEDF